MKKQQKQQKNAICIKRMCKNSQEKLSKYAEKYSGITLISLVITIIILIILAGVSISLVLGENGLFTKAKNAAENYKEAAQNEQKMLDAIDQTIEIETENLPTIEEAITGGENFAKEENKKITDGKTIMWLPKGFTIVNPTEENTIKYDDKENPKIDEGIVVQDPQKNEFVWVPVVNINDMVYCQAHPTNGTVRYDENKNKLICSECGAEATPNFAGKLYASGTGNAFDGTKSNTTYQEGNGIREPDVVTSDDEKQENLKIVLENYADGNDANTFKTELQAEFNKMATSVGKYKGFYIGRYETSNLSYVATTYNDVSIGQVVQGASTIGGASWYKQYVSNKKIGNEYTNIATTSMIWGCQWDATMRWFLSCGGYKADFVKNSSNKGNYSGSVAITGSKTEYAVNNIYDMAGNVWDWTIEANRADSRILRGNRYDGSGSEGPVSIRGSETPLAQVGYDGSRSELYINL